MEQKPLQSAAGIQGLQGLSGGWVISTRGLGIRTGYDAEGPAYLATFWTNGALSAGTIAQWNAFKKQYAEESAVLGQKGAYGKLAALGRELNDRFDHLIEDGLRQLNGVCIDDDPLKQLALVIEQSENIDLIGLSAFPNHIHVLFCLSGESGVDSLVASWKQAVPGIAWDEAFHVQAILPVDCDSRMNALIDELGETTVPVGGQPEPDSEPATFNHVTVLLNETVDMLEPKEGKVIVDATLGGGGHTELMLERGATVWGIDQDPDARRAATARLSRFGNRFKVLAGNFREVANLLAEQGIEKVDGLLADLGISSHQVDTAERGFSFREEGPLDMRMSPDIRKSAADLVNEADEKQLADIIWQYGEERASRQIARAIVRARENGRIETTSQLANIISSVLPRKGKQHPGTRAFQALRIFINDELGALDDLLEASVDLLNEGGRMAVITFHSLEDRRVKQFFDHRSRPEIDRKEWPAPRPNPDYAFKLLNKKPIVAGEQELSINPRSRSAKLRGVEKIN